jgi:hypothetical protein
MVARVWVFQPALGRDLYRGQLTVRCTNSRTESISYLSLDSLNSFRFLEPDKTGLMASISFRNGGDWASCDAWAGPQLNVALGGAARISLARVARSGSDSGSSAGLAPLLSRAMGLSRVKALPLTWVGSGQG